MKDKKCYRIIEEANNKQIIHPCPQYNLQALQNLTKSLLQQHKFMYIDINEQQGFKIMKECQSSDEEEEVDKIGRKYVVNLNNLFSKNSKGLNYIRKFRQQTKQKDNALELVKEQLKRSTEKIQSLGKTRAKYEYLNQLKFKANKTTFDRYSSTKAQKPQMDLYKRSSSPGSRVNHTNTISYSQTKREMFQIFKKDDSSNPKRKQAFLPVHRILPDIKANKKPSQS